MSAAATIQTRILIRNMTKQDPTNFGDRLAAAVKRCGNPVVVGLDPRWDSLPESLRAGRNRGPKDRACAYERFCRDVIDVVAPLVPAVKLQAAFYEELGPHGMVAMAANIIYARRQGLLVILDGKRNDIGSTAEAYARAYLGESSAWQADALTVSPYLGDDSLAPFVDAATSTGAGIFVLVKTSNPGSGMLQDIAAAGTPIYRHVADHVEQLAAKSSGSSGYGCVGAVVGATYPEQLAELRAVTPHTWFLVPGFGSQGGTAADVAGAFDGQGLGAIINNSSSIIFAHSRPAYAQPFGAARWQEAVAAAARDMIDQLRAQTPAGRLSRQG
jgi:orotidine-5'-phosphate decarboxylase